MARASFGLDSIVEITNEEKLVPLVTLGLFNPIFVHPNSHLNDGEESLNIFIASTSLRPTEFFIEHTEFAPQPFVTGDFRDYFTVEAVPNSRVNLGSGRVRETWAITPLQINTSIDDIDSIISINFNNDIYMGQNTITITQQGAAALTGLTATSPTLFSGTQNYADFTALNPETLLPVDNGVINFTVTGESGFTYTVSETGNVFTGLPSGVQSSGAFSVNVNNPNNNENAGSIIVTNSVDTSQSFQFFFNQLAENEVNLIVDTFPAERIAGENATVVLDASNGDANEPYTIQVREGSTSGSVISTVSGTLSSTGTLSNRSITFTTRDAHNGQYFFTLTEGNGTTSNTPGITIALARPTLTGTNDNNTWNDTSANLSYAVGALSSTQRGRLSSSDFSLAASPSAGSGTASNPVLSGSTVASTVSGADVNASLTAVDNDVWRLTLTVGPDTYTGDLTVSQSVRPEVPLTFPNNPSMTETISAGITTVTFEVYTDIDRPNISLSDASSSDTDIWSQTDLNNASIGAFTNPLGEGDVTNINHYSRQKVVSISGGNVNSTVDDVMDAIQVTSSI